MQGKGTEGDGEGDTQRSVDSLQPKGQNITRTKHCWHGDSDNDRSVIDAS